MTDRRYPPVAARSRRPPGRSAAARTWPASSLDRAGSSGVTLMSVTWPAERSTRSISASSALAATSSRRVAATTSSGWPWPRCGSNCSQASVSSSHHCTSSRTSSAGRPVTARRGQPLEEPVPLPGIRHRLGSGATGPATLRRDQAVPLRAPRPVPAWSAPIAAAGCAATRTPGPGPAVRGRRSNVPQEPGPVSLTAADSSSSSLVFPMPASPDSTAKPARRSALAASAAGAAGTPGRARPAAPGVAFPDR